MLKYNSMIDNILNYSQLNNFLDNNNLLIDSGFWTNNKSFIISLNLDIRRVSFIKENFDDFVKILENILFIFNQNHDIKFKNISFTNIKIWWEVINNCIFLYDSEKETNGYIKIKTMVEFEDNINNKNKTMKNKILDLALNNSLSVRNLIKLWLNQTRARNLYSYFKEEWVIQISEYNNMNKKIDIEKLKNLLKI